MTDGSINSTVLPSGGEMFIFKNKILIDFGFSTTHNKLFTESCISMCAHSVYLLFMWEISAFNIHGL